MRILFVIHSLAAGGAERVTAVLSNAMAALGHDVAIAVQSPNITPAYVIDPRVRLLHFPTGSGRKGGIAAAAISFFRQAIGLRRLLRAERPDFTVGMMSTAAILLGVSSIGLPGRFVGSERAYPPAVPLSRAWSFLRRYAYGCLHGLVVQSHQAANWALRETRARDVWIIGNPVSPLPLGMAQPSPAAILPPDAKLILVVGRLVPQKRIDHAIAAFARVLPHAPGWHLAILGEGRLRPALEEIAADIATGRIHFVGRTRELGDWYARAEVFLLTSQFEGMPNAMMEAMAHGAVPIAYDIETGPAELVQDEVDGMLVVPGDVDALAARLRELIDDEPLRIRMQLEARSIVDRFGLPGIVEQWLAIGSSEGSISQGRQ